MVLLWGDARHPGGKKGADQVPVRCSRPKGWSAALAVDSGVAAKVRIAFPGSGRIFAFGPAGRGKFEIDQGTGWSSPHWAGMPRYFFHTRDGEKLESDEEGTDLPDDESAGDAAKELLAALNHEKLPYGDHMSLSVAVQNAEGREIYVASLRMDGLGSPRTTARKRPR